MTLGAAIQNMILLGMPVAVYALVFVLAALVVVLIAQMFQRRHEAQRWTREAIRLKPFASGWTSACAIGAADGASG